MLAALDRAAAEAVSRAPAVFFIDELDGFNARSSSGQSRNESYIRSVITGLLRQLDRLMATAGVVLIGATNDLFAIDPAIKREGRFDSKLLISPPNLAGRAQILQHHLDATDCPALTRAIGLAAERMEGASGAAAAALARAACARQRATGSAMSEALLTELATRYPDVASADRRRIALHEAGHVIVGLLSGMTAPKTVRLTPEGGEVHWPATALHTRTSALAELRMLLAGRAAEQVFFKDPSNGAGIGPKSDLAQATQLARRIEMEWGMGDGGLIWYPVILGSTRHLPWLHTKLDHLLTTAQAQARAIISTHRDIVEALAEALLQAQEITGPELEIWTSRIRDCAPVISVCHDVIPLEPD